jgi:two-component system sensor histidine kinase TtrS
LGKPNNHSRADFGMSLQMPSIKITRIVFLRSVYLLLAALLCAVVSGVCAEESSEQKTIKIGVLDTLDPNFYVYTFAPTMEYLRAKNPGTRFRTVDLDFNSLLKAAEARSIDFFIATSGFYGYAVEVAGAQHIATRRTQFAKDPESSVAAAFVTRKDTDIKNISEFQSRKISAYDETSFSDWIIALAHLANQGLDIAKIKSNTIFTRFTSPDPLVLLMSGKTDIAILPACELEAKIQRNIVKPNEVRVIYPESTDRLKCQHSTDLYPDIVFASLPSAESQDVEALSLLLLSMPQTEKGIKWGLSNSFKKVSDIYKKLEIGPFDSSETFTFRRFYENNKKTVFFLLLLILFIAAHSLILRVQVNKRTRELRLALEEKDRLQEQLKQNLLRINEVERYGLLSFMSNLLMHEIRQPVTALINFSIGLSQYLKQKNIQNSDIDYVCRQISAESRKIEDLIKRIRNYAKGNSTISVVSLTAVAEKAVQSFYQSTNCGYLETDIPSEELLIDADSDEIEIVILNLLKNAFAAVKSVDRPKIRISISSDGETRRVEVRDNGPRISESDFQALSETIQTSKKDGFGLGLVMCRIITEKHGGHLAFMQLDPQGLMVTMVLPKHKENENAPA